ncbi:PhnE/PtxC family ABC transporter permease [Rubrobacter radiotolerans]|uniref:Uncharacterized protein n=1 Tax=Rubrobacter radiotolerans TaxID=42256 RepID=A0AB35T6U3_RUBRA|nr:hypothetical protein [Rubrobacter radiotolerans]MDX5895267.1 hypothetical protein [Rubrobacter radiotolerans]
MSDTYLARQTPLFRPVQIALVGTVVGALVSVPLAFLAAQNITPHWLLCRMARGLVGFVRSIPDFIWGLIFVSAVGLGPFPGTLALALGSGGMLARQALRRDDRGRNL